MTDDDLPTVDPSTVCRPVVAAELRVELEIARTTLIARWCRWRRRGGVTRLVSAGR